MTKSAKKLICIVSVISIFVAITIGILIYKFTKEETPELDITIQSSITLTKGETKHIGYDLYIEDAIVEATSSDNSVLLIKEIKDKNIVVTAQNVGEVTMAVKVTYKGKHKEKNVAVKITEDGNSNEEDWYDIKIVDGVNFTLVENVLFVTDKTRPISFTIDTDSKINGLPNETDIDLTFDKEVVYTIRSYVVTISSVEECVMTIIVKLDSMNYEQTAEYIIRVE